LTSCIYFSSKVTFFSIQGFVFDISQKYVLEQMASY